ncbi:MAG: nucleotide sugar dehydrogenase [Candidatus Jorgensenbacteria bacterium]|nr:nucleotide sugar dehydrogenase [Candidatus Jorgensenbacteria bacterium]
MDKRGIMEEIMKLTVYGSWHLAEVYAVGLCELGHEVNLVSSNTETYENYKKGKPPVFEPGISEGIKKYAESGKLSFSNTTAGSEGKTDICFFAQDVNITPEGVDMKDIQDHFRKAIEGKNFKILCVSSQLPIGTCRRWQEENKDIDIVYFPEFLRFGDALKRFIEPDYIVLGGEASVVQKVSEVFKNVNSPKFSVSLEEAEMAKHAANIFVAMTVSFISELTKFSEHFDIDFEKIGAILRADKRIGPKAYTLPGLGFSGTVKRDIVVLINEAKKLKKQLPMFEQIIAVNDEHNKFIEYELKSRFQTFKDKKIGFLGATYKPFTSNMRGSLVAPLMEGLKKEGALVVLYDPLVENNPYTVGSINEAFSGADAVVIAVSKKEFREAPHGELISSMRKKVIIDAANMFKKEDAKKLGVDYSSIGRGKL